MSQNTFLFYDKPANADIWEEALPLGNGSFGAMLYGGIEEEVIRLNQESVWYGGFRNRINPDSMKVLPKVRELIFDGQLRAAEELVYTSMFGTPLSQGHYEPLADLKIAFNKRILHHSEQWQERQINYSNYKRLLDLQTACYNCSYTWRETDYKREALISYPDQVMAIRLTADNLVGVRIELDRGENYEKIEANENTITLSGSCGGDGSKFIAKVQVISDGTIVRAGAFLEVENASEIVLYVAGRTDFYEEDPLDWCNEKLALAVQKGYEEIRKEHIADYSNLYQRVDLDLNGDKTYLNIPTNERLRLFKENKLDDGLLELYYNYGRYLLISSSREGALPANLQGIWNKDMMPAWGSKYTININTQMNYWPAEVNNLSECHTPLFDHIKRMVPHGREVAEKMYGCRGIVAHHNTDIYGDCAPQGKWMPATMWPMGFAWLATHVIEHYRYSKDINFAKDFYYIIRDASLFYVDYLIRDKENQLVTCPSTSPENTYILENGEKSTLCYGPSMDSQIIKELWTGFIEISRDLEESNEVVLSVKNMIKELPKAKIGSRGQLLEWTKEFKEWEAGHRHISHLYGLYPGSTITSEKDKDFFEASKVTINERLSAGGGHTGWSRGWIINMWARLLDGEKALYNLQELLCHSTAHNLFDLHPSNTNGMSSIFQIDGNFGGTAGLAEMLLQSHEDVICLLPALPQKWENGYVTGLKARGNIEVNLWWENGKLKRAEFLSSINQSLGIKVNNKIITMELCENKISEYVS